MDYPQGSAWKRQDQQTYTGWNIYLSKLPPGVQDYDFSGGSEACYHARTRSDAAAAIEYLKIKSREVNRLGASFGTSQQCHRRNYQRIGIYSPIGAPMRELWKHSGDNFQT